MRQYCKYDLALADDNTITDFNVDNATTDSFKIKEKITGKTENHGTKNVEIMVPLKYLSKFGELLNFINSWSRE